MGGMDVDPPNWFKGWWVVVVGLLVLAYAVVGMIVGHFAVPGADAINPALDGMTLRGMPARIASAGGMCVGVAGVLLGVGERRQMRLPLIVAVVLIFAGLTVMYLGPLAWHMM